MRPNRPQRLCVLGLAAGALAAAVVGPRGARADGPDVIVGDLNEVHQYTQPADDPQAYSLGTISCNIGTDVLQWVDFNAMHPVIAGNMYRVVAVAGVPGATRIEQIGQSWLKHGFIAIAGSFCNTCPAGSPSGSVLGVGCADPYGAVLNGLQNSLGPRSEVNPATGVFPYPASWSAFPDRTGDGAGDPPPVAELADRRIRVARTDLLAPGAVYVVEGQYISRDDAAAANGNNNASYRRIAVDPSLLSASPVDSTRRMVPAIYAWRDHGLGAGTPDPSVAVTPIDVPGDGRFLVASKITQINAGQWHYEYAVQNLNSDRGASAFGLGVGGGTISSPGFHDSDPHSGEVGDATDWTLPIPGPTPAGLVMWRVFQSPNQNPRGNALRWGTLYNFWFNSTAAPALGQGSITPFKLSGTPPSPSVALLTPGGGVYLNQFNDECASALTIGPNQTAFSTSGALDAGPAECASAGGGTGIVKDIWFRYIHGGLAGPMTVSTCGSSFDTKIAVYGSACPSSAGAALACSDDAAAAEPSGCGPGSTGSFITVGVVPGGSYLIRVGGSPAAAPAAQSGNGLLTLAPPGLPTGACCRLDGTCQVTRPAACNASYFGDSTSCSPNTCPPPSPPVNDLCANAEWIGDGQPVTATNAGAGTDASVPACASGGIKDVWYKYQPSTSADVDITTDNSVIVPGPGGGSTNFDTSLALYTACPGAGGTLIDCDDDGGTSPETSSHIYSAPLQAGHLYLIRVSGYPYMDTSLQTGVFTLKVIGGGGGVPLAGACCTGTHCTIEDLGSCTGSFLGRGTPCGPPGNPTTCCPANINGVGGVTIQDIFDFLIAYFSGSPAADFNHVGGVTVQDIFDFLIAYFAGCPS